MVKARRISISALDKSPSHLLHRALQLALDLYALEAESGGLTQRQYAVLCAVAADEGLSQTGLVLATGIDRSTLADMVARLIGKGLLARERSTADARANTVRLTDLGREALAAATPRVEAADRRLIEMLGPKKRDPFLDALRRLTKAGDAAFGQDPLDGASEPGPKSKTREVEAGGKGKKGGKKKRKAKAKSDASGAAISA
jgi:DNA-binding MarR family transcriptional regulator